ncbi:hypothetical protein D3C76_1502180 [compost metagenome]
MLGHGADPVHRQQFPAARSLQLPALQDHFPSNHQPGQLAFVRILGKQRCDHFPFAHDRNPIGGSKHFLHFMRRQDDGFPFLFHATQRAEQTFHFTWS